MSFNINCNRFTVSVNVSFADMKIILQKYIFITFVMLSHSKLFANYGSHDKIEISSTKW